MFSIGVALSVLALVSATSTRGKTLVSCAPVHSRLIVADARAKVFEAPEPGPIKKLGIYGCAYGRSSYFIGPLPYGSSGGSGGVAHEILAGPMVAFEEYSSGGYLSGTEEWHVVVRNLRNGRLLHRVPTGTPTSQNPGLIGAGFTSTIVVKTDGAVAWIVEKPIEGGTNYEVHALNKMGSPNVLAFGTNIGPASLALAGSDLYWTQGGQAASPLLH
jgi:hypothetical protein